MKTRREEELTVPNRARLDCQSHSRRVFLKTVPAALLKHGYSESVVTRIVGGNFMRLFREVAGNRG